MRRALAGWRLPLAFFLVAFFLDAFRVDRAPDVHGDEIMYTQAGINVATKGRLTWLEDVPVWVHPPLFFLAEAAVASTVPPGEDVFRNIFAFRFLSALFGALSTVALFALVREARGRSAAALAAVLFLTDPFVIRICRRVMLETQMVFLVVLGLWLAFRWRDRLGPGRIALVGVVFGLALLTKEIAIFSLAALPLFAVFRNRELVTRAALSMALGLLVWSAYPVWAAGSGAWDEFRRAKLLGAERLAGVVPTTSWRAPAISLERPAEAARHRDLQNLPKVTLGQALRRNVDQYASSYVLIGLGPMFALGLWRRRGDDGSRFLASWYGATAAFLGVGALLGTVHVQFGYVILPPACALAGAALVPRGPDDRVRGAVIGALLAFAVFRWIWLFGVGSDDSYRRLARYLDENVPAGSVVNSSQPVTIEPASRWLFPNHRLTNVRRPEQLEARGVRYAILSSKDVWGGYGRMSVEYVRWLRQNGETVFHARGNTYWDLELLELPVRDRPATSSARATASGRQASR